MSLRQSLESLLLVSAKPVTLKKLAELTQTDVGQVATELAALRADYRTRDGGVDLLLDETKAQLVTTAATSALVQEYLHEEVSGELTRPSLETLTIIAYRQPVSKEEIEYIRGINCGLILRNLLIRGLIESEDDAATGAIRYRLSFECLKFLGITDVTELPDYAQLNASINLDDLLKQAQGAPVTSSSES